MWAHNVMYGKIVWNLLWLWISTPLPWFSTPWHKCQRLALPEWDHPHITLAFLTAESTSYYSKYSKDRCSRTGNKEYKSSISGLKKLCDCVFSLRNTKACLTLPNQPCPISFRYSRLWRPRSDDFSSWTGEEWWERHETTLRHEEKRLLWLERID